jgi:CheY-like chemotaxis protein
MVIRRLIILHVEDNFEEVRLLHRACEAANLAADFHEAPGGLEAVAYLKGDGDFADRKRHPLPDLIILDLKMPGMNGFEFLQWLRQEPEFRTLPVLVFTALSTVEDRARALAEGASGFFMKPPDFPALVKLAETLRQFEPRETN